MYYRPSTCLQMQVLGVLKTCAIHAIFVDEIGFSVQRNCVADSHCHRHYYLHLVTLLIAARQLSVQRAVHRDA